MSEEFSFSEQLNFFAPLPDGVCALTGHRVLAADFSYERLRAALRALAECGTRTFLCGMALGFDLACADEVLALRPAFDVGLVASFPCAVISAHYPRARREQYVRRARGAVRSLCRRLYVRAQPLHGRSLRSPARLPRCAARRHILYRALRAKKGQAGALSLSCAPDLPQSDGGLPFGLSSRERAAVILNFFPFARLTRCVGRAVFFAAENLEIK